MLQSCQCEQDGYCTRYGRQMRGRFREICQGINVDLGTAAAFRMQWAADVKVEDDNKSPTIHLLLKTNQAPGDALAMTAAIHSLHRAYPNKYVTAVDSPYPEIFDHNPDVVPATSDMSLLQMHYPAIIKCNERGIHFMQGWCEFLGSVLNVPLPLLTNRPQLYFADPAPPVEDYWVICSGGKRDFTNKLWGQHNYQEVVDRLQGRPRFVQVGTATDDHPRLSGTTDMVGKTSLRGLFDIIRRSRGVLCGVSLLMHVAAALEKPAIVIAGGREPVQWNSYTKQQYVHTIGALPCKSTQGHTGLACWRSRVVPLGDHIELDKDTCERPVNGTPTSLTRCTIPACMDLIRPESVAELVLRYDMQYEC